MLQQHPPSASHKHTSPDSLGHSATIRNRAKDGARKRNRPSGILPTRIAKVEKNIEGPCVAMDCACCMGKWSRVYTVTRAMLEQNELHLERGEIRVETFARNFKRLMEIQRTATVEMRRRKARLDDVEIPELRSLCAQAERAA